PASFAPQEASCVLKSDVAIERVDRIVAVRVSRQIYALSAHRPGLSQESSNQSFAQAVAACFRRHCNRRELTGTRWPLRRRRLNSLNTVEDFGGERWVANQCGKDRQRESPPGTPHQMVEFRGIHKAAHESFQNTCPLAHQQDSRTVIEHQ